MGALIACLQSLPAHKIVSLPEHYAASFQAGVKVATHNRALPTPVSKQLLSQSGQHPEQSQPALTAAAASSSAPLRLSPSAAPKDRAGPVAASAGAASRLPQPQGAASAMRGTMAIEQASASPSTSGPTSSAAAKQESKQAQPGQPVDDADLDALLAMPSPSPSRKPSSKQRQASKPASSQDDSFEDFLRTL